MRPFGDHTGDGLLQLSFTFPVPNTRAAGEMAMSYASRLGMHDAQIIHQVALDSSITHFTLYAKATKEIDYSKFEELVFEEEFLTKVEVENRLLQYSSKSIVIVGAATGTDTHSLGIDAILNMKGYNGEYGLERYVGFKVVNLGSQVSNKKLIQKAIELNADVILLSQTVTQQGLHKKNLKEFNSMSSELGLSNDIIKICGGPYLPANIATEFGFDTCFSKGCLPNHVATFIISELERRAFRTNRPKSGEVVNGTRTN